MLLILDVLFGKMESVNSAPKDGMQMHKKSVFLLVIYVPHGMKKELVNHVIMVILLNKVHALKIMI